MALLLLAAIPLFILAGYIAYQNYRMAAGEANQRVLLIRQAALARYYGEIDESSRLLSQLALLPQLGFPGSCQVLLGELLSLQLNQVGSFAVFDGDGSVRCSAGPIAPLLNGISAHGTPWFEDAQAQPAPRTFVLGQEVGHSPLVSFHPLVLEGGRAAMLAATFDLAEWLAEPALQAPADEPAALWIAGSGGHFVSLRAAVESDLPNADTLAAVEASSDALSGFSRSSRLFAYASYPLTGQLRLIAAYPAGPAVTRATRRLTSRMAELSVLLLVSLAAIVLGANAAIVEPLKRLSSAVRLWRAGGVFDVGQRADVPLEVRELTMSFSQATNALAEREAQLRKAVGQQDLLMQEIHHRVKNNLQIIASLLNLQASRIRVPEAKAEFQAARDRIRALATLHRHLYAHGELHTINMRSFITELCTQLLQAMGERVTGENGELEARIKVEIEAPELQISSDQAVPMALIVTEAVSNAAKYAFPDGRRGSIKVRLTTEGDMLTLVIEDDGVGIPAGRVETEAGVRDGIGIHLIRGFARQLGASLTVTQENGTRYEMTMKPRRDRPADDEPHAR